MTLPVRTKSARMLAERDLIDAGSGPGVLELLDAASTVLAPFTLQKPCGSTGGTDTLTLTGPLVSSAIALGGPVAARLRDSAGNVVRDGLTVGTSGTDIVLSASELVQMGQGVTLTSATIKHAA